VNTKQDLIKQASSVLKTHTSKIGKNILCIFFNQPFAFGNYSF